MAVRTFTIITHRFSLLFLIDPMVLMNRFFAMTILVLMLVVTAALSANAIVAIIVAMTVNTNVMNAAGRVMLTTDPRVLATITVAIDSIMTITFLHIILMGPTKILLGFHN